MFTRRRGGRGGGIEVTHGIYDEALEAGVAFVEAPPDDARPLGGIDVVQEPVPSQGTLAEATERAKNEQRMRIITRQPVGKHVPFGNTPGEVRRHGVGMGQKPMLPCRLHDLGQLGCGAEGGEELAPGEG